MRRLHLLLPVALLLVGAPARGAEHPPDACTTAPPDTASAGYTLVWADEFDRDGRPDPRKWTYETGFVRNQELQWYRPENARVEDGLLVIEARRERVPNPAFDRAGARWKDQREHAEYTSASVTTRGLLLANAAWAARDGRARWDDVRKPIAELADPDWSGKFHVWRMDWDEEAIRLYVDDVPLNTIDLRTTFNRDGLDENPLRQPHYVILNLAVGGSNGGDPSLTEFPARFEIDYVRVCQKQPEVGAPGPGRTP